MMTVIQFDVRTRTTYEAGQLFGDTGAYERIDGRLQYAVDPLAPAQQGIVDLDRAARDADGLVRFWSDVTVLQPADPNRGNRTLLYLVANRGRRGIVVNRPPVAAAPTDRIEPGDGFLLRRGWTLAWSGWQWDVPRSSALIGLEAPEAFEDGRPIVGEVMAQFQPDVHTPDHALADREHEPYPAADVTDPAAKLLVRDWLDGPATEIPRRAWRFARAAQGGPEPDPTRVWLERGFEPGRHYQVLYRTNRCPVVGSGLLAVRDAVSFLRFGAADAANPCAGRVDHTLGTGGSQSGRFLRAFLHLGLNVDEAGRPVFDGLLPVIAGAHRGEFNHRYAQPSVQAARGFGQLPPFTDESQDDPRTGERQPGLLERQRALGSAPRTIYLNTAAEYWPGDVSRGDASLQHIDLAGTRDIEPPPDVRIYVVAGAQHNSGALPLRRTHANGARGAHFLNVLEYSTLSRAALIALERWIVAGEEPPPNALPRLADHTAAPLERVLEAFGSLPEVALPDVTQLPDSRRLDLGPEVERGIGRWPAAIGAPLPRFVSAVDRDGNELAGIRLPDVAVPVATYTGWNPRDPETGSAGQLIQMWGSTLPFPATAEERRRRGDPRPAISERYHDRVEYRARARAVAEQLAAQRYLLPEDVALTTDLAVARYDALTAVPAADGTAAVGDGRS